MRAVLEYNLPEEEEAFDLALAGHKYHNVVWDMDEYLRQKLKYEELSDQVAKVYEDTRRELHTLLQERNLPPG